MLRAAGWIWGDNGVTDASLSVFQDRNVPEAWYRLGFSAAGTHISLNATGCPHGKRDFESGLSRYSKK